MRCFKMVVVCAFHVLVLHALAGATLADGAEEWMKPGNGSKYLRVGDDVYSIETLQPVTKGVFTKLRGQAIKDSPGMFYVAGFTGQSLPGIAIAGRRQRQGEVISQDPLEKLRQGDRSEQTAYLASDLRRVAYLHNGDWWRGEVDWAAADVVNRTQVTSIGQFKLTQLVLGWFGNYLFVLGNFDASKPIVRIDLVSGEPLELPVSPVFEVRGMMHMARVNPARDRLICASRDAIHAFDPFSAKAWTLPSKNVAISESSPVTWLDDDTAVVAGHHEMLKVDLGGGKTKVIKGERPPNAGQPVFLPGGQFALISEYQGGNKEDIRNLRLQVVDLRTEVVSSLAIEEEGGTWLDDRRCIYSRSSGGLAHLGTYLFDRESQKSVRLSNLVMAGPAKFIPERDEIFFPVDRHGYPVIFVRSDGSNPRRLEGAYDVELLGEPLDLGWGKPATELWDPARYKPRPVNSVSEATLVDVAPNEAQSKQDVGGKPGESQQPAQSQKPAEEKKDSLSEALEKANKAKRTLKGIGDLFKGGR